MYVCLCSGVTDDQIRDAVQSGVTELSDLQERLGVATNCGICAGPVREMLPEGRSVDLAIGICRPVSACQPA